jgi:hypothetical protein
MVLNERQLYLLVGQSFLLEGPLGILRGLGV